MLNLAVLVFSGVLFNKAALSSIFTKKKGAGGVIKTERWNK